MGGVGRACLVDTGVPHASVIHARGGRGFAAGAARCLPAALAIMRELVPTDDAIARMYETAIETLAKAGLVQYEISNFAQRGV